MEFKTIENLKRGFTIIRIKIIRILGEQKQKTAPVDLVSMNDENFDRLVHRNSQKARTFHS